MGIIGTVWLISAGRFDPPIVGELAAEVVPGPVSLAAGESRVDWLTELPALPEAFTIILDSRHLSGERDVAYGLVVGAPGRTFNVAVSPIGYVAIWEEGPKGTLYHMPWQPWPHVRPEENEIWLERDGDVWRVRTNRELLWEGELDIDAGQTGLSLGSSGGQAELSFPNLVIYH